jgi:hypothetical protein
MENKQTAVEWLQVKMATSSSEEIIGNINLWFKQAKEMEKKQIVNAYLDGTLQFDNAAEIVRPKEPAVYYNETYGGDK